MLLKKEKLCLFFVPFLINSLFGRFELDPFKLTTPKIWKRGFYCFCLEFLVGSGHFISFLFS